MVWFSRKPVRFRMVVGLTLLLTVTLTLLLAFLSTDTGDNNGLKGFQSTGDVDQDRARVLQLNTELVNIDTDVKTMTLDWTITDDRCILNPSACTDAQIFFLSSNNLISDTSGLSNNPPSAPIYYFNATAFNATVFTAFNATPSNLQTLRAQASNLSPSFRTTFTFKSEQALQRYPFDSYISYLTIFAVDPSSNNSVSLVINNRVGAAVGYILSTINPFTESNDDQPHITVLLVIKRGPLIRLYAIVMIVAIWIVSLVFLVMTIQTVFFLYPQRGEALIAPAATLFAFTSLRGTMPGSPPFGAFIDYVGTLPCLAILALSASLTAGVYIFRDPTNPDTSLANPAASDVVTQRFAEALLAAGDAVAYHAEAAEAAQDLSNNIWKAEGAKLKAAAAARQTIDATYKTIDAAEEIIGSSQAKAWRRELINIQQKAISASLHSAEIQDKVTAEEIAKAAGDAAGVARDAIDVAKRAAAVVAPNSFKESTRNTVDTEDSKVVD